MPNQVGCLPFFPVMPHNHSSPSQGGQLDEKSWGSRLIENYFVCVASDYLMFSNDTEKSTNDTSGILLKEITISSFLPYYYHSSWYASIMRIKFDIKTSNTDYQATAGVYLNGTLKGTLQTTTSNTYITKTQDLNLGIFNIGDKIQLIGLVADPSAYCYVQNFRLYFSIGINFFKNVNWQPNSSIKPYISTNYSIITFTNTLT